MNWARAIVYMALIVLALLFLVPLGVVVANSLRTGQEIAATSMIGWPRHLIFGNYAAAWNQFCELARKSCASAKLQVTGRVGPMRGAEPAAPFTSAAQKIPTRRRQPSLRLHDKWACPFWMM